MKDIINYYEKQLKYELDIEGNPLYIIDVNKNIYYEDDEKKSPPLDFYTFRSDSLNNTHFKGLLGIYYCLKSIFKLMSVVCSYPEEIISGYKPNQEEIITALEEEMRQYAKEESSNVERDLRKIAQRMKTSRNTSLTPDVWGKVMEEEDELFELAISDHLGDCEDAHLENISATKEQLVDNYSLLQKIKTTCLDEELFDIRLSVETHNLLSSLNADNLDLFYELVLRRNIIHREMFPDKLRAKYEDWLNPSKEEQPEDEVEVVSRSDTNINCFKFSSDFIKQKVKNIVNDYYQGIAANLALIEVTLFDHNQLKKRNAHTAFLKALMAWDIIDQLSDDELKKTTNGMAYKLGSLPSSGYMEWDVQQFLNDKKTCTDIGKELGPTIPYGRNKEG